MSRLKPLQFILAISLLLACQRQANESATATVPVPTVTPTLQIRATEIAPTPFVPTLQVLTPTPTPHIPKIWQAPPVLVELYEGGAFGRVLSEMAPRLVLYANGQMIGTRFSYNGFQDYAYSIWTAQLAPSQVCDFLEQFATDGFFEPEAAQYRTTDVMHQFTSYITVEAWRQQNISAYALGYMLNPAREAKEKEGVYIPPALATTYLRLTEYLPPQAKPYVPDRIVLEITKSPRVAGEPVSLWPVATLRLSKLVTKSQRGVQWVVLEGTEAKQVYWLFDAKWEGYFREGSITYRIWMVPLLPLQELNEDDYSDFLWPPPYTYPMTPTTHLDCER